MIRTVHKVIAFVFATGEHCCAVGYALHEFSFKHSRIILEASSGILLGSLAVLVFIHVLDRKGRRHA